MGVWARGTDWLNCSDAWCELLENKPMHSFIPALSLVASSSCLYQHTAFDRKGVDNRPKSLALAQCLGLRSAQKASVE